MSCVLSQVRSWHKSNVDRCVKLSSASPDGYWWRRSRDALPNHGAATGGSESLPLVPAGEQPGPMESPSLGHSGGAFCYPHPGPSSMFELGQVERGPVCQNVVMSTGRETIRAHERDAEVTRIILESEPDRWRTPAQWTSLVWRARPWRKWHEPNQQKVGVILRRLVAEGDMERRQNPDDARSGVFRVLP